MRWFYEMTANERKSARPQDIVIGFDRLDRIPITLDKVCVLYVVWPEEAPADLNRKEQRYK